jgi:hypothetical protein
MRGLGGPWACALVPGWVGSAGSALRGFGAGCPGGELCACGKGGDGVQW